MNYDYNQAALQNEQLREKNYKELRKSIEFKNGEENKFLLANVYLQEMEDTIERQAKEIKKYKNFFDTLQSLLPYTPHINDVVFGGNSTDKF